MNKNTGIIRRIDDLGRIVIPRELRRVMGINEGDPLELIIQDDMVCFKKYDIGKPYHERISELIRALNEEYDLKDKDNIVLALENVLSVLKNNEK